MLPRPEGRRLRRLFAFLSACYVIFIHSRLIASVPDPFLGADSGTYLEPALSKWLGGDFALPAVRSVGYPFWILLNLSLTSSLRSLIVAQHLLVVAGGAFAGVAYYFGLRRSAVEAWTAGGLVALLPKSVFYAHFIMSEVLYSFLLLAALAVYFAAAPRPSGRGWLCLGAVVALANLVRPVGLALLVVFGAAALAAARLKPRALVFFAIGAGAPLLCVSAWNLHTRGFFGLQRFAGASLFGVAARYLDVERLEDERLKRALGGIYSRSSEELKDPNWVRFDAEGPAQAVNDALGGDPAAADSALLRLSARAIRGHPLRFACDQAVELATFVRDGVEQWEVLKEPLVFESLKYFGKASERHPAARNLLRFDPAHVSEYRESLRTTPAYPIDPDPLAAPIRMLFFFAEWAGCLGLFGSIFLLRAPATRSAALLLLGMIACHAVLATVGAGGDYERHTIHLEPLYLLLALSGGSIALKARTTAAAGLHPLPPN